MSEKVDRNAAIIEGIKAGKKLSRIARELGISKQRVHQVWQRLSDGAPLRDAFWTKDRIFALGKLPDSELARQWGICADVVSRKRKSLSISKCPTFKTHKSYGMIGKKMPGTRLTILAVRRRDSRFLCYGYYMCTCRCDCGKVVEVQWQNIFPHQNGKYGQKSCGCLQREMYKAGGGFVHLGGIEC